VSLSPTMIRNEKVEHYIRIKTHKPNALRFLVESGVVLPNETPVKPDKWYQSRKGQKGGRCSTFFSLFNV